MKAVETGDTAKLDALLSKKSVNPTKLGSKGLSVYVIIVLLFCEFRETLFQTKCM